MHAFIFLLADRCICVRILALHGVAWGRIDQVQARGEPCTAGGLIRQSLVDSVLRHRRRTAVG